MAYGIKYTCSFTSIKGLDYKIHILKKDYNSAVYSLRMGGNPVQINYTSGSENKFEIIRGSECVLSFFSEYDGQFTEIMNADKGEYMVQVWVNESLHWQGFIIQDNYSEPFQSAPYLISLRATDGLGDLKLIDFATDKGSVYLNQMTFVEVLLLCLAPLQNGTELITSNDVFETRIDRSNISNESFNQLSVNPFIFLKNELNASKSDVVLKMILELFQCYIYYKKGKYYVERISYKLSNSITRRKYNINFSGAQSIANTVSDENIVGRISKDAGLRFINNDQISTYAAAYNKVTVNSDVIDPANLIVNNYFRFWDENLNVPFSWVKSGTLDISKKSYPRSGDALQINSKAEDNQISFSTNNISAIKTSFQGSITVGDTMNVKLASMGNVRFLVKATTKTKTYYLTCSGYTENNEVKYDGWFKDSPSFCKIKQLGNNRSADPDSSFFITNLDVTIPSGTIRLETAFLPSFIDEFYNDPCVIREFTPTIKAGATARSFGDSYILTSNKSVRETYDEFNPKLGEFGNIGLTNQILLLTSTGATPTNLWYRDEKIEGKHLIQIAAQSILNQYRMPFRLFSGTFFGDLNVSKVYEIETLRGRFMPFKSSSDLKFDQHQVEFFELLPDLDAPTDKYTRYLNFKDGDYSTFTNVVGGRRPSQGRERPGRG